MNGFLPSCSRACWTHTEGEPEINQMIKMPLCIKWLHIWWVAFLIHAFHNTSSTRSLIWSRHWSGPPTFHAKIWDCSPCHLTRICSADLPLSWHAARVVRLKKTPLCMFESNGSVLLPEFINHRFIIDCTDILWKWLPTSVLTSARKENMRSIKQCKRPW